MRPTAVIVGLLLAATTACSSSHDAVLHPMRSVGGFSAADLPTGLTAPSLACATVSSRLGVRATAHDLPDMHACHWASGAVGGLLFVTPTAPGSDPAELFVTDCGGNSPLTATHRPTMPKIAGVRGPACFAGPGGVGRGLTAFEGTALVYIGALGVPRGPQEQAAELQMATRLGL